MARYLLACGCLALLTGVGLIPPVLIAAIRRDEPTSLSIAIALIGGSLIAIGLVAIWRGMRRPSGSGLPSGARMAIAANVLFLAFFALELSDRLITRNGKLFYWSTFLLPPTLALFYGLLAARPWAWRISRGTAALGTAWFSGFLVLIPFAHLEADGVPTPWYGRLYMAAVTLAFAAILTAAFRALGNSETRRYFGVIRHPAGSGR